MRKIIKIMLLVLAIAMIPGVMITGCKTDTTTAKALVGQKAPDFTLQTTDGETISLSDFEGKPVLLNFWRINCPPCIEELPYIQEVYSERIGSDLVILAINVGDIADNARQFAQDNNLQFTILLDSGVIVARDYNIPGTPVTFFIDKDGIIQAKVIGSFPSKAAIDSRLEEIIS